MDLVVLCPESSIFTINLATLNKIEIKEKVLNKKDQMYENDINTDPHTVLAILNTSHMPTLYDGFNIPTRHSPKLKHFSKFSNNIVAH
jgi:hypothetical protein